LWISGSLGPLGHRRLDHCRAHDVYPDAASGVFERGGLCEPDEKKEAASEPNSEPIINERQVAGDNASENEPKSSENPSPSDAKTAKGKRNDTSDATQPERTNASKTSVR
jgi:hypothetical protein